LNENAESKKDEQSKRRNELVNKKLKIQELSIKILSKKRKDEDRDLIIDEMIKVKESKREFFEISMIELEREFFEISMIELKREFLEVRMREEVKCEVLELENENDE
jgi:hypothetical protein